MNKNRDDARSGRRKSPDLATELDGMVDLGMKREALRTARRALEEPRVTTQLFGSAMNAILTHQDRLKTWRRVVEAAYARLPKRRQRTVHFWMLSFHYSTRDYEAASRFIPRRFDGECGLTELAFA